ncbi:MAG: hypothetical protein WAU70_13175 [Flavobacteriales bacterium]
MMRALLIGILVLPMFASAQDGLPPPTKVKAGFRPLFQFDTRYTFIDRRSVQFYGIRLGAQKGRDILAIGFYGIGDPLRRDSVLLVGVGVRNTVAQLDYAGLTYQHLFVDSRYWQISLPVLLGLGSATTRYVQADNSTALWSRNEVVSLEPMAKVSFKFFSWLYLDTGAGYRLLFSEDPRIQRTYSAWTYDLGLVVRLGQLYRSAREGLKAKRVSS